MKEVLSVVAAVTLGMAFSGCTVTTKNVEMERTDQAIAGNRGFFKGTPPPAAERKATRQHIDVDVELPHVSKEARSFEVKDTVTKPKNNPGVAPLPVRDLSQEKEDIEEIIQTSGEPEVEVIEEEVVRPASAEPAVRAGGASPEGAAPVAKEKPVDVKKYVVQKNDTLEKIAARPEIYGDSKKWYSIYKANKDKLKGPDKIYPGQEFVIPPVVKEEK